MVGTGIAFVAVCCMLCTVLKAYIIFVECFLLDVLIAVNIL